VFVRLRATLSNKEKDFANAAIICAMPDPFVLSALMLAGYEVLSSVNNSIIQENDVLLHWKCVLASFNQSLTGRNIFKSLSEDGNLFSKAFFLLTDSAAKTYEETLTTKLQKLVRI
jgi:hypothetical protein